MGGRERARSPRVVIDEERRDPVELVVAEPWRAPADGVEAADLVLRLDEELLAQSAAISSAKSAAVRHGASARPHPRPCAC